MHKPKVIYILGHAFSGSTLFSLALGADKRILNLGEVSTLEHDYNPLKKCTCGSPLQDCLFWKKLKLELDQRQANTSDAMQWHLNKKKFGTDIIDRRHRHNTILQNFRIAAGVSAHNIYPKTEIYHYLQKNELFFKSVQEIFPEYEFLVDCSKSSKRLEIFLNSREIDFWVIYLQRQNRATFASRMKRVKKRKPKSDANFLSSFTYAFAFAYWQRREMARCVNVFKQIDPRKRIRVSFDAFVKNPETILSKVHKWLGMAPMDGGEAKGLFTILPSEQHIYVGNRWLFKNPEALVKFRQSDGSKNLSISQRMAFRIVFSNTKHFFE